MTQTTRLTIYFILALSVILHPSSFAGADGGNVRLSEQKGNYRITVFTSPNPLRAGPADISVLVQDAATQEPVAGVQVIIMAQQRGSRCVALRQSATTEAATNKLYYAASLDLPEPGCYEVEATIDGTLGKAQVQFDVEAVQPLPQLPTMWLWVSWPILAIVLFGIHQVLVFRHKQGRPAEQWHGLT